MKEFWSGTHRPMFRSDRSRKLALTALWVVTAFYIVSLVYSAFSELMVGHYRAEVAYREYQEQTERYEKEAAEKVARICGNVAPLRTPSDCILREMQTYQNDDRAKKDLKAQQDMAEWSYWLLVATIVGIFVSIAGLAALLVSLSQTRTAIRDTRELGEFQMRAYVSLVEGEKESLVGPSEIKAGTKPEVKLKFTNNGATPAKNQRYIATLEVMSHPAPEPTGDMIVPTAGQHQPTNSLHQGQFGFGSATTELPLTEDDLTELFQSMTKKLYAFGIIYYDDVFGKPHKTRFCYYLDMRALNGVHKGNWYQTSYHNDAN